MEEDTEEMKKKRSLNQSEIDPCWKKMAERMEEEVLDKYKVRVKPLGMEKNTQKTRDIKSESGEKTAGQKFSLFREIQLAAFAKQAGGVKQKRRR